MTDRPQSLADADARRRPQVEIRNATVMVVDMVGSTETIERLGPEASALLLEELLRITRPVVTVQGGVIMNEMGDGFVALFGAPVAIERASLAACRAGTAVLAAVQEGSGSFAARFGVEPRLRVGLAEGEVLVTGQAADGSFNATGSAVNLASRLQALAPPGAVVFSAGVAAAARGWARFEALGSQSVRGFPEPVETFALTEVDAGPGSGPSGTARFSGAFVGRGDEIGHLLGWHAGSGEGRPVSLIVGEAGIGKSRLVGELAARLGGPRPLVGSCQPTTTARALAPLIEILRGFAGWRPGLPASTVAAALEPVLPPEIEAGDALVRLIAGQAEPDAEENPSQAIALRDALGAALTEVGQRPDCLIVVEDLHWIDPLSADVLLSVIASAPPALRMLGTTRPVDWLDRLPAERIETLRVGPMSVAEIGSIAEGLMGAGADAGLVGRVAQTSEGNPFFAIEILHTVASRGDGVEAGRIGAIQNIALARFDRLSAASKAFLRMASVLGRSFRNDVLKAATGLSEGEFSALAGSTEGIVEPDPADPAESLWFHHILFRDSIYATIPSAARREMHLAAARALETAAAGNTEAIADVLADHYEQAGQPVRAVRFLGEAAHRALGLYALESCRQLTERAFRLIETDPAAFGPAELEAAVLLRMRSLDVLDLFNRLIEFADVWLPRLRMPEGSPAFALMLSLKAKAHCQRADLAIAHEVARDALEMAERLGHERAIVFAKAVMMRTISDGGFGTLDEVERLYHETRAYTEEQRDEVLYVIRMFNMIFAYETEGLMARALEVTEELQAFGERHRQPHVVVAGDWNRALIANMTNDFATSLTYSDAAIRHSRRNTALGDVSMMMKLAAQLGLGIDFDLDEIERIYQRTDARGEYITRNAAATQHAYGHFFRGKIARGWRLLRDCEPMMEQTGTVLSRRFFLLNRAELFVVVGGYVKIDGPAPKLGLADIAVALYLRMIAGRRAKALLAELLSNLGEVEGLFTARAHACLGVIAAREGRREAAQESFEIAERIFRAEGLTAELARLAWFRASGSRGG